MVSIEKAFHQGKPQEALRIHQKYFPLMRDLFIESNPVPIKAAMSYFGWVRPSVRLPLTPLTAIHMERLKTSLIQCGVTEATHS
jgi:4-hydroxy-tetrahydrodipicolinate synthase